MGEIEQGTDGFYTLCVFGAEDVSDSEVMSEFETFGSVGKLHRSKNIVFVRYNTLEEAKDCYESMQNNARFIVKPGRRKANAGNSEDRRHNDNYSNTQRDNFNSTNRMDNRDNNRGSGDFRGRKNQGRGGGGDFNARGNEAYGRSTMPPLIPTIKVDDEMKPPPPLAKEVVIGNLHPKMKQHNIYELCSKAKAHPLHVAMKMINRPPYPTVYYSYVYVKSDEEAKNIVDGINNLTCNGYMLVAATAEKLDEEGKASV